MTAHEHLVDWDPCIDFCGVPDEAQYGFALTHANGGRGLLASRQPGHWALWFQSPYAALNEEWSAPLMSYQGGHFRVEASVDAEPQTMLHLTVAEPSSLVPGAVIDVAVDDGWIIPLTAEV